jgi:hypothetical protein
VLDVGSADIMATLLLLKAEVEERYGSSMKMVFSRATEAHLIAKDIGVFFCRSKRGRSSLDACVSQGERWRHRHRPEAFPRGVG